MDQIANIINVIRSVPGADIVLLVTSIIGIASVIVKFTPTPADDALLGKVKEFLSKYIALNK